MWRDTVIIIINCMQYVLNTLVIHSKHECLSHFIKATLVAANSVFIKTENVTYGVLLAQSTVKISETIQVKIISTTDNTRCTHNIQSAITIAIAAEWLQRFCRVYSAPSNMYTSSFYNEPYTDGINTVVTILLFVTVPPAPELLCFVTPCSLRVIVFVLKTGRIFFCAADVFSR